jgi:hypothetical protein
MTAAASALIVFGLTALAEWLHGRRIRVADRWRREASSHGAVNKSAPNLARRCSRNWGSVKTQG